MHYLIKDTDFSRISQFLEQVKRIHTNNLEALRLFLEAVYFVLRSDCQWRLLPTYYGNWRAVHKRFKAWIDRKIWQQLYDVDHFTVNLANTFCIPSRKNHKNPRTYDEHVYKERHAIECFIGKIKYFRRVFSLFDKSAIAYLSFLYLVEVFIWCR